MYNVARASETGGTKLLDQPTFNSIQPRTRFQLHSSEPGRIYYEVKQVGDASYPLSKHKAVIIPRSDRPLFEQEVLMRPSARFRNANNLAYCVYDAFSPRDQLSSDGYVLLEGTPPFELTLSVRNIASSENHVETVTVIGYTWKLDLPSYIFKSAGRHVVIIESVRDSSHCDQRIPNPQDREVVVDVAESAAIRAFDGKKHFCVGEAAQFQLEGIPPWTIGYSLAGIATSCIRSANHHTSDRYRINGKTYTQETQQSPFAVAQQHPGEFTIMSIAHQQRMCKSTVADLRYTVHPLPSAQVGHGKRIYQDIHEGMAHIYLLAVSDI